MDEALVEYAEDDVDDDQRRENEQRLARERALERLRIALEAADERLRLADLALCLCDGVDRLSERDPGRQVERERHRRELALMRDR